MTPRALSESLNADEVIRLLALDPHPTEGGFFRETYRARQTLGPTAGARPADDGEDRCVSTAIYYLLTPETLSALHRLDSDEVFHHYAGDTVEQLRLHPDGRSERVMIGSDLRAGERPQTLVPRGVWQGARLVAGGRWALLGCTVAPGFEFDGYEHGDRATLCAAWPAETDLIVTLTP
jgi:hypothetical protein